MDGYEKIALLLRERDNPDYYAPVSGRVEALPGLKIRINSKIVLERDDIESVIPLYDTDGDGNYIWLNKKVFLLPWYTAEGRLIKFLVIGGDSLDG